MNEITKFSNRIKISYFSYIFILVLIIILNTFYQENISILMNLPSTIIFYIFISLQSLIGVSQIIFFVISNRETYKLFSLLLKIIFVLAIISLLITLSITYFYYITNKNYPIFYRDCPFNFNLSDIDKMINISTYNKLHNFESNSKCNNRICIEHNIINNNNYTYICNFNSSYKDLIFCNNKYDINMSNLNILQNYNNFCSSKIEFYLCQRSNKHTRYYIDYNYECPIEEKKVIILGIILSIFNIITPTSIDIIQFILYKKIINLIYLRDTNALGNSHEKKTNNTSNNERNPPSFEKQPSEMILVENKIKRIEENQIITKRNQNILNNNSKIFTAIITTIIPEINNEIDNNEKERNIINNLNLNHSFNNYKMNGLELDSYDLLNIRKSDTRTNYNKNNNSDVKYYDNSSNVSKIKLIKFENNFNK